MAVADDNIYRFAPNDERMAEAIVEALWHEGIRKLALLYREDSWGSDLAEAVMENFKNKGGAVIGSESYNTIRMSVIQEKLAALSDLIAADPDAIEDSSVGFQLICYKRATASWKVRPLDATLRQVPWFGADGFVQVDIENLSEERPNLLWRPGIRRLFWESNSRRKARS